MEARLLFYLPDRSSGFVFLNRLPQQPFPHAALSHGQQAGVQVPATFIPLQVHEHPDAAIEQERTASDRPSTAPTDVWPTTRAAAPTTNALIIVRIDGISKILN